MTLDEARTALEAARTALEAGFTVGPRGNYHQAPTGEPYVEVCSGNTVEGGDGTLPCLCSTPELAIRLWFQIAVSYAGDPRGKTLYWRIPPELGEMHILRVDPDGTSDLDPEQRRELTHPMYAVYSRFLVSGKPQIQPAVRFDDAQNAASGRKHKAA